MSRGRSWIVLAFAVGGCGGGIARVHSASPSKAGELGPVVSARITAEAGWPFRVDRVALLLDGAPWEGDAGVPVVVAAPDSAAARAYRAAARNLAVRLALRPRVAPSISASLLG